MHGHDVAEDVVAVVRVEELLGHLRADKAEFLAHTNYLGLLEVASLLVLDGQDRLQAQLQTCGPTFGDGLRP